MTTTTPLVPSKEVCARLDIDRSTLTRWVAIGRIIPAMRMPGPRGAFLFNEADVAQLARERTAAA